jgi:hypothetical protein
VKKFFKGLWNILLFLVFGVAYLVIRTILLVVEIIGVGTARAALAILNLFHAYPVKTHNIMWDRRPWTPSGWLAKTFQVIARGTRDGHPVMLYYTRNGWGALPFIVRGENLHLLATDGRPKFKTMAEAIASLDTSCVAASEPGISEKANNNHD